jgi:hypothetical protein
MIACTASGALVQPDREDDDADPSVPDVADGYEANAASTPRTNSNKMMRRRRNVPCVPVHSDRSETARIHVGHCPLESSALDELCIVGSDIRRSGR